ncbi:MAG TPA: glucose-6-phosphate dehydrogenase [Phycisphaerales bacterium]|nr:glucose-6-phosphate dehydrogenase [Phycisphaerales bacterium]
MFTSKPEGCVIVIYGASGDLTSRKLLPALYEMAQAGWLPANACILGVSRTPMSDADWRTKLTPWIKGHAKGYDEKKWQEFSKRVFYCPGNGTDADSYRALTKRFEELNAQFQCCGNILFYLSVAPSLYEPIIDAINESGLVMEGKRWCRLGDGQVPWQRIIVEKPFGTDTESAAALNRALGRVFEEDAIYRIDHYLAKELVQSLLVVRFANTIFEPIWNHRYIDHVQITAAETVGVGSRAAFYDEAGAIRDMIQSHLLQVLALVAMEPPTSYTARNIRNEKIKIVEAIQITPKDQIHLHAALGQYAGDASEPAYHLNPKVPKGSATETFAALSFRFDNWRWAGTPFYVRTGKRLAAKRTEIVIQFKQPPADLFKTLSNGAALASRPPNQIIMEIAPKEGVHLRFEGKVPGQGMKLGSVTMDFDYASRFNSQPVEAYGPLIIDAMRGDQTLFKHRFEVENAWEAVMPFLGPQSAEIRKNIQGNYQPGSWGPASADELLARDGRAWHNA